MSAGSFIKGWRVYAGEQTEKEKRIAKVRWKHISPLFTVRDAAKQFAELAEKSGKFNGKMIEVRDETCG